MARTQKPRRNMLLPVMFTTIPLIYGTAAVAELKSEPIKPIPLSVSLDQRKVKLGKELFHDKRLSKDNTVSCSTCHDLNKGGTDHLKVSVGIKSQSGNINSPTVFNSGFNFRQFWDGRAPDLEEQAIAPIENPVEMGSSMPEVIGKLKRDNNYVRWFEDIYPDGISPKNVKNALAIFQQSLITPNSRFDQYLRGNNTAITEFEKRGYQLFKNYGCVACHQGMNVGGNMYQKFGVLNDYFGKRGNITQADLGRYNVTGDERDKHVFKVPSLRLVALTPPYLHDGSAKTLREAVDVMFEFQLGRHAPEEDKNAIVAFLTTLAGDLSAWESTK